MVGCQPDSHSLETVRPYLESMGHNVIPCGAPGTGSATKLCNNLALATQMIGVCEAMNLGEALGVDPAVLASVMDQSTAGCWSSRVNNPHPAVALAKGGVSPASRDYGGGFAASLMLKDLGLAVAAAEDAGVAVPLTATSKELYRLVRAHKLGGKDFSVMLKFLRGS
jgi:3-hydroxyisobutyrate dehydrogenase